MSTHIADYGFRIDTKRVASPLPHYAASGNSARRAESIPGPDWLDRLATWTERQPMHHRMGSYTVR